MSLVEVRMVFSLGAAAERVATVKLDFETSPDVTGTGLGQMASAASDAWNDAAGGKIWFPAGSNLARVDAFTWEAVQVTDAELVKYPKCAGMATNPYKRVQVSTPVSDETDVAGTRAGTPLPPNVAVVASFRSGLAGRRRRGRAYFPPLAEGDVDASGGISGTVADGVRDSVIAVAVAVEASIALTDIDHVVWSHCDNVTEEIAQILVNQRVDTQRRRLGA